LSPQEAAASTAVKFRTKNSNGPHHFRFLVSLQADCCYFHGVAPNADF
jgi:hypothetical protein